MAPQTLTLTVPTPLYQRLKLGQYELTMLVRAQAAALLRQRGHDVSSLLGPP